MSKYKPTTLSGKAPGEGGVGGPGGPGTGGVGAGGFGDGGAGVGAGAGLSGQSALEVQVLEGSVLHLAPGPT